MSDGKFFEILLDHTTGRVAKSEPITQGEDLADARKQMQAFVKAKKPLGTAVDQGRTSIGRLSGRERDTEAQRWTLDGPVMLLKGSAVKAVSESLE